MVAWTDQNLTQNIRRKSKGRKLSKLPALFLFGDFMKLKSGRFYLDADNRIYGPMIYHDNFKYFTCPGHSHIWDENGRVFPSKQWFGQLVTNYDLVARLKFSRKRKIK